MPTGQKHLVRCRCILPQFKHMKDPLLHQFTVFSILDDADAVAVKFAQCTNCGLIHKVTDINRSEIMTGREHMSSIATIDEIKISLPEKLVALLEINDADLPTYEAVSFILENKQWGNIVVLSSDVDGGLRQGKYVRILGEQLFKIDTFTREEYVTNK